LAVEHHYRMPLGCEVKVTDNGVAYIGTMGKHDTNKCIVNFKEHNLLSWAANPTAVVPFAWVSYRCVRPTAVHRVRPWWRVLRERRRRGEQA
jgi:hypothetical protein